VKGSQRRRTRLNGKLFFSLLHQHISTVPLRYVQELYGDEHMANSSDLASQSYQSWAAGGGENQYGRRPGLVGCGAVTVPYRTVPYRAGTVSHCNRDAASS
jgi:hypothetical protein